MSEAHEIQEAETWRKRERALLWKIDFMREAPIVIFLDR